MAIQYITRGIVSRSCRTVQFVCAVVATEWFSKLEAPCCSAFLRAARMAGQTQNFPTASGPVLPQGTPARPSHSHALTFGPGLCRYRTAPADKLQANTSYLFDVDGSRTTHFARRLGDPPLPHMRPRHRQTRERPWGRRLVMISWLAVIIINHVN